MNTISLLVIIFVAALVHASFQLSISMLTLLSSHTLGAQKSHARLLKLTSSFTLGAGLMTLLLLSFTTIIIAQLVTAAPSLALWVVCCGLLFGLGVSVWLFYYRKQAGTSLWVPRGMANYLTSRTKATKHSAEAFGLGLSSVVGEMVFISVPILLAALSIAHLPLALQLPALLGYGAISLSSLVIVYLLVGGGHKLSNIQRWREENKLFLQFIGGSGLIALGCYVYVEQVLTPTVMAAAGAM